MGLDEGKANDAIEKLKIYFGSFPSNMDNGGLIEVIEMDKKNKGSSIRMSLLKSLGQAVPNIEVSKEDIIVSINTLYSPSLFFFQTKTKSTSLVCSFPLLLM